MHGGFPSGMVGRLTMYMLTVSILFRVWVRLGAGGLACDHWLG